MGGTSDSGGAVLISSRSRNSGQLFCLAKITVKLPICCCLQFKKNFPMGTIK